MRVLVVVSVLLVAMARATNASARVTLYTEEKFNGWTGRTAAFDYCRGEHNLHIAHSGQMLQDHEERKARHDACAWSYERFGPRRVTCDDEYMDDDDWCKQGHAKVVPCRDEEDKNTEYGVYCRKGSENESWEYKAGEMLEAVTFNSDDGGEKVYSVNAAKAVCEGKGMALAYSSQLAALSARYDYSECRHCFLRKNHATYSVNCDESHDFDFWIQDTDKAQCFTCFGMPETKKYEHPCKMNNPTYAGKNVFCDRDSNGKINGDIIIQSRPNCEDETDNKYHGCRFASAEWHQFKNGFGETEDCMWMGLELQHVITNNIRFGLRIEIEDQEGKYHYIQYEDYTVADENREDHVNKMQYVMKVGQHIKSDEEGDDLTDQFNEPSTGNCFSTISGSAFCTQQHNNDRDLPTSSKEDVNCAAFLGGVGWWFACCDTKSNLNGLCPGDIGYSYNDVKCRIWGKYRNFKKSRMVLTYDKTRNEHLGDEFHDF